MFEVKSAVDYLFPYIYDYRFGRSSRRIHQSSKISHSRMTSFRGLHLHNRPQDSFLTICERLRLQPMLSRVAIKVSKCSIGAYRSSGGLSKSVLSAYKGCVYAEF